jgi:hypothetical protein
MMLLSKHLGGINKTPYRRLVALTGFLLQSLFSPRLPWVRPLALSPGKFFGLV